MKKLLAIPMLLLAVGFVAAPGVTANSHDADKTVRQGNENNVAPPPVPGKTTSGNKAGPTPDKTNNTVKDDLPTESNTTDEESNESDREEDKESNETTVQVATLEEARERIAVLQEQVRELRAEIKELRSEAKPEELPEQASDRAREARGQSKSVDAESENQVKPSVAAGRRGPPENRGPSEQARNNVNGTPGNNTNRPSFVNRMLQSMFG